MGDKSAGQRLGDSFRTVAGLPPREGDAPSDPSKVDELNIATEPEGGYGGDDGISNSGAITRSEQGALTDRDEKVKAAAENDKSDSKPAKKTTAKKAAAKKTTAKKAAGKRKAGAK